jgi:hypothetical protein
MWWTLEPFAAVMASTFTRYAPLSTTVKVALRFWSCETVNAQSTDPNDAKIMYTVNAASIVGAAYQISTNSALESSFVR